MTWMTGSFERTNFNSILNKIKTITNNKDHKIFVGTDSFKCKGVYVYTTAICLINRGSKNHCKYFYKKEKITSDHKSGELALRLFKETTDSVEIANFIKENIPSANIEVHLDVSGTNTNNKTSKWATSLSGIVSGSGFEYKLKPYAIAASAVADRHTKAI